ncbi:RSP_7527 family protein [Roseovarius aestuarii]|uniref:RSP_7527 family protein n=1 Tax=Roseovarius aestuarii TaxID=475083 RepID=UPI001593FDD8|nr:hypothetical protein [Roseovarius aestuarii]
MNTEPKFTTPSQAEVDRIIAKAHRLRGEYMTKLMHKGVSAMVSVFTRHRRPADAAT